jgi:hypothetical protein
MPRRHLIAALAVVATAAIAVGPADAASKPKPFKGSKEVTDATPDPTPSADDAAAHCEGVLPAAYNNEALVPLKIPAPGKIKMTLANTGDWAIDLIDPKGTAIQISDGGLPNDPEGGTTKVKKAGTYKIHACNLGGSPTAKLTWAYTPSP